MKKLIIGFFLWVGFHQANGQVVIGPDSTEFFEDGVEEEELKSLEGEEGEEDVDDLESEDQEDGDFQFDEGEEER